jgi:putative membrane protein insertion efficiency factor
MTQLALGLIKFYQNTVSKVMPSVCRFQPTCSQYALEAIKRHGFARGSWLAAKRIARCNPFSEGGYDPVP